MTKLQNIYLGRPALRKEKNSFMIKTQPCFHANFVTQLIVSRALIMRVKSNFYETSFIFTILEIISQLPTIRLYPVLSRRTGTLRK